ncbi:FKBP-type peptidyl-prolyl cis-trans isomerase [uncultured Cytophaga sp.]|uniref:FKBP-type peptidyl-prolyl cis-trans isomerase n=1 Tax=uncultured Cytophaga sp. TaxID=160238 RepID=UPI00260B514E|nr:FKBP-type peptidyl-prolyl cis-trans isomerase [uncultured Cytophaga sp.]
MLTISENKVVRLTYELSEDNNKEVIIEKVETDQPATFLFGVGGLLPEFEQNLFGLKEGDTFKFSIASDNAYGPNDPNALVDIPKEAFAIDGKLQDDMLKVGSVLPMRDNEDNFLQGTIMELRDDVVIMDFNHPLAGKDLFFKGTIVDVREATAEEISHGHVHGEGGHQH